MGLIKAAMGAAGGVMADQWKEFFYCDAIPENVLAVKGQKKTSKRSSNTKGDDNVISNGSVIAVADGQCMLIVDQGKIVDMCAVAGEYTYDMSSEPSIFTGDLGELGHTIVRDFFRRDGMELDERYQDCGMLLYDRKQQDMHAGASGCGCSASVLNGYLLTQMRQGRWQRIVFAPTGALLSPVSTCQGESIPSICHAVCLSAQR